MSEIFSTERPYLMGEMGEGASKDTEKGLDENEDIIRRRRKYFEKRLGTDLGIN